MWEVWDVVDREYLDVRDTGFRRSDWAAVRDNALAGRPRAFLRGRAGRASLDNCSWGRLSRELAATLRLLTGYGGSSMKARALHCASLQSRDFMQARWTVLRRHTGRCA